MLKLRGIGKMSTFAGFCWRHDNEIFEPIDTQPLQPTVEQAALYAHRSLCREFFVYKNAPALAELWSKEQPFTFFAAVKTGRSLGFESLKRHKVKFVVSLKERAFSDDEYVLMLSHQKPTVVFSGVLYPHFDFLGRRLQTLDDVQANLDLNTICSAAMKEDWGFLFAWHKSSGGTFREFMGSLAHTFPRAE